MNVKYNFMLIGLCFFLHFNIISQPTKPPTSYLEKFINNYRLKQKDVTVVLIDGSISTDMGYASKRPDAAYRPPCCTEYNIPSFIEEKLRWQGEQFRRYDANKSITDTQPAFSETGIAVTQQYDSAWDWQNHPPVSNGYNGLTRILSGEKPSVSYDFPAGAKRCDFIYRTDYLSSTDLVISTKGGLIEVFDEIAGSWREANGFRFSAAEKDSCIAASFFPGKPFGATALRKTVYQKRLKMRIVKEHPDSKITITSRDGKRLCYWGIAYSPSLTMFQFINSARGGHDIEHLKVFEEWSVDEWRPDLIVYSCNTINEGADASKLNHSNSPVQFAGRFEKYINSLLQKPYAPEVFAYILFTAKAHNLVDSTDKIGSTEIEGYGRATVFNFIDTLYNRLSQLPVASANAFYYYWQKGSNNATAKHTRVYTQFFGNAGTKGDAFTADDTHLNDNGARIGWEYLSDFFDF